MPITIDQEMKDKLYYYSSNDIEDEYHFVCICPCNSVLRTKYINKCYYVKPSVYKYLQLLKILTKYN